MIVETHLVSTNVFVYSAESKKLLLDLGYGAVIIKLTSSNLINKYIFNREYFNR